MQAKDLLAQYVKLYKDDDVEIVEFMVEEYAGKWNELTALQIHLRDSLNADDSLSTQEKKDRDVGLSAKTDEGIMLAIHGLLVSDSKFTVMGKAEVRDATMFGVVQRECRDSRVSVQGIAGNILEMKRKLYDKRRWVWDVKEVEVQYDVQSVDSKEMVDGIWWYSVTWCDGDKTVEPRINLEGAEDMVVEFEKEWAEWEAANAKPAHGGRVARKAGAGALPLGVAGAGAGEPSELQQAMVMMAQSILLKGLTVT